VAPRSAASTLEERTGARVRGLFSLAANLTGTPKPERSTDSKSLSDSRPQRAKCLSFSFGRVRPCAFAVPNRDRSLLAVPGHNVRVLLLEGGPVEVPPASERTRLPAAPEAPPTVGAAPIAANPQDVAMLIADSNPKFPLTQTNAEAALKPPPGVSRTEVAGPSGTGPDIRFFGPGGLVILQREVKSIAGNYNSFNQQLSKAAKGQLQGTGEVFVQVPQGTDIAPWLQTFHSTPGRNLNDYAGVNLQIVDDAGNVLCSCPIN
jgi:hypothetical protein